MVIDIQTDVDIDRSMWGNFEPRILEILKLILHTEIKYIKNPEVSILLTDDDHIQNLNRTYRHQDKPTNVLSFPLIEKIKEISDPSFPEIHLGDIIVSVMTLQREAHEQGKTPQNHLIHMIVHGVLHLLGYDHLNDEDATEMEAKEIEYLAQLGISDPYNRNET